jgi:hypothetical protein
MSAFVCSNKHISAILGAFAAAFHAGEKFSRVDEDKAQVLGQLLLNENQRSVNVRYHTVDDPKEFMLDLKAFQEPPAIVPALRLCACLKYQSCEADDWRTTEAIILLDKITTRLITKLPGWEDAPWSIA